MLLDVGAGADADRLGRHAHDRRLSIEMKADKFKVAKVQPYLADTNHFKRLGGPGSLRSRRGYRLHGRKYFVASVRRVRQTQRRRVKRLRVLHNSLCNLRDKGFNRKFVPSREQIVTFHNIVDADIDHP